MYDNEGTVKRLAGLCMALCALRGREKHRRQTSSSVAKPRAARASDNWLQPRGELKSRSRPHFSLSSSFLFFFLLLFSIHFQEESQGKRALRNSISLAPRAHDEMPEASSISAQHMKKKKETWPQNRNA